MPSPPDPSWTPPQRHPQLAEEVTHVWRANLETVSEELGELLSTEEQARAARFLSEHDRLLWTRAHGVLRALLGRYLDVDPRTLRFLTGEHGKPELLLDQAGPARLRFNLSHSGPLALFAFSERSAVGVDAEVARRPIDEVGLAARTFGRAEAERLRALDPATREREFLRAWTRHEAALKCRGTGIGRDEAGDGGAGLWIAELELGERAAGAVALEHPPRALQQWEWPARAEPTGS